MDVRRVMYMMLARKGKDFNWLAGELGMKPQSLRNKLSRGTYSYSDMVKLFGLLDCEFVIRTKEGEIYR